MTKKEPLVSHPMEHVALRCPGCGESTEPDWDFCERCGGLLSRGDSIDGAVADQGPVDLISAYLRPATFQEDAGDDTDADSPERAPKRWDDEVNAPAQAAREEIPRHRIDRRRLALRAGIAGVVIALAIAATSGWVRLNSSQHALSSAQARLQQTSKELTFTEDVLKATRQKVTDTQTTLRDTESKLADTEKQLHVTRGSLSSTQERLDLQAGEIDTLQTCLAGVSNALSYVAGGDYGGALASLRSVDAACEKAYEIL